MPSVYPTAADAFMVPRGTPRGQAPIIGGGGGPGNLYLINATDHLKINAAGDRLRYA